MTIRGAWRALWTPEVQKVKAPGTDAPEAKASATWPVLAALAGGRQPVMGRRFEAFAKEGYRKNVVVYACISMLAQSAASVPWRVFRGDTELTDGELVDLVRFLSVLGKVGPFQIKSARLVRRWRVLQSTPESRYRIRRTRQWRKGRIQEFAKGR